MRDLWVSIAHTSGARIYSLLVGLIVLFLTARLLGPEGRGHVAAIMTWVSMFSTFGFLSLGQVALHRMATDRNNHRLGTLIGSLLLMAVLLSFAGWLVAIGLYVADPQGVFKGLPIWALVVGFLALPFFIWEQYGSSVLLGLDQVRIYNRYQVLGRTFTLFGVLGFVALAGLGVLGVVAANFLGQLIVALGGAGFLISFLRARGQSCRPDKMELFALLSGGAKLHLNAIGTFLFTSANILILNHYHGADQTGQYQLALQLLSVLLIVPQAASMVIYGKVTSMGPNVSWPLNRRLLMQVLLGMVGLSLVAGLLAPPIIIFVAGEAFGPAADLFQWMLLGLIGMTFSTMLAPQWIGRGYFWQAAALTMFVGILNLGASFLMIPLHGMWGAVYAFIATYAFSVAANGLMAFHCQSRYKAGE